MHCALCTPENISRSIVTQRSSKVEANQNTASLTKESNRFKTKTQAGKSRLGEHGPLNSGLAVVLENKSAYKKRLIF